MQCLTDMERNGIYVDTKERLPRAELRAVSDKEALEAQFMAWATHFCPEAAMMNVSSDAQARGCAGDFLVTASLVLSSPPPALCAEAAAAFRCVAREAPEPVEAAGRRGRRSLQGTHASPTAAPPRVLCGEYGRGCGGGQDQAKEEGVVHHLGGGPAARGAGAKRCAR